MTCHSRVGQNFWNLINIISLKLSSVLDYSTTQKHKDLVHRTYVHIALSTYIIQRKFWKIQRKISKVSILTFKDVKPPHRLYNGISLHSWCPDASFDTHIAISRHDKSWMLNMSFMSKMPKKPCLRLMPSDICYIYLWQYGCQKMRRDLRNAG